MKKNPFVLPVLAVLFLVLAVACTGGETGLSRAEVDEIVRAQLANVPEASEPGPARSDVEQTVREMLGEMPRQEPGLSDSDVEAIVEARLAQAAQAPPSQPEIALSDLEEAVQVAMESYLAANPGVSRAEVEGIIQEALVSILEALASIPEAQMGLTAAAVERIARGVVASIPPRSAPGDYTRFFVSNAISRHETQGPDTTLAYYNREGSVDGQWYVFIIDENDIVIGHPDAHRLGLDVKRWVGTDANGYNFGPDMLSATEDGKWVSYVYSNPESGGIGADHTGALEYKHVWAVRHDGLLFASGWYVSADEYTRFVVDEAIARYHAEGLDEALTYYNDPDSVDAQWYVFIAAPEGEVLGHYNAEDLGVHLEEMLQDGSFTAAEEGMWVTHEDVNPVTGEVEDKHFWLVLHDGLVFGSGWHHDESGS